MSCEFEGWRPVTDGYEGSGSPVRAQCRAKEDQKIALTKRQGDCIVTSVAPVAQVDRATDS